MPLVTAYRQDIRQHMNTIWQQKKHAARVALEEAMQALRWSTPHVSAVMREGANVSEEILDLAEQSGTDLIVVGCKGKSAIQRFLLGSITNRIAGHAHCSVWAVRI
jgi:nucleotide-binding universal stress UspA family protein